MMRKNRWFQIGHFCKSSWRLIYCTDNQRDSRTAAYSFVCLVHCISAKLSLAASIIGIVYIVSANKLAIARSVIGNGCGGSPVTHTMALHLDALPCAMIDGKSSSKNSVLVCHQTGDACRHFSSAVFARRLEAKQSSISFR